MIVTCEACDVRFSLDERLLRKTGSKVRCSKCKHVFTVFPPESEGFPESTAPEAEPAVSPPPAAAKPLKPAPTPKPAEPEPDFGPRAGTLAAARVGGTQAVPTGTGAGVEDLEEQDFSLNLREPPADRKAGTPSTEALQDLDFNLEPADTGIADVSVDELISDFDFSSDAAGVTEEMGSAPEDLDLAPDLGTAATAPRDRPEPGTPPLAQDAEQVDMDPLDFKLDLGEEPPSKAADTGTPEELKELELDLDFMDEPEETALAEPSEPEPAPAEALSGDAESGMDQLNLDLDDDLSPEPESPELDLGGELDLSDLEAEMPDQEPGTEPEPLAGMDDLGLDLDMKVPATGRGEAAGLRAEAPVSLADDLDLSDLESSLGDLDAQTDSGLAQGDAEDQELELDLGLDEETGQTDLTAKAAADQDMELDFSDIEDLIDSRSTAAAETGELELDLDLEETPATAATAPARDDLFDIESPQKPAKADADLTLDLEDEEIEELEGFGETIILAPEEQRAAVEAAYGEKPAARPDTATRAAPEVGRFEPRQRAGLGKPVWVVIVVALIGAVLFGGLKVMDGMGIRVPFVGDLVSPEASDPGNAKFVTTGITSMFVDNDKLAKLFVISGKVRNEYAAARKEVKIAGKLYTQGKQLAATKTVYAGNVISGPDLATIDMEGINRRLNNPDVTVGAGQEIGFMVIFANLPEALEEFTIEVMTSTPEK